MTTNPLDSAAGIANFKKWALILVAVTLGCCVFSVVSAVVIEGMKKGPSGGTPQSGPLVGTWSTVRGAHVNFVDPSTGALIDGGGDGSAYELKADGTFAYSSLTNTSIGRCSMRAFVRVVGTWSSQGSTLLLDEDDGVVKTRKDCGSHEDSEYPPEGGFKKRQLAFRLGDDRGTPTLEVVGDGRPQTMLWKN